MTQTFEQIGPNRYRESFGRHFEDFNVGDVYEHRPGRTICEADNVWFTLLTMNKHPLHFDKAYAAKSEFKPEGHRQSGLERHQAHGTGLCRRHDLRGVAGDIEAPIGIAAHTRHRDGSHSGQEGQRDAVHELRADGSRSEAGPCRRRVNASFGKPAG
jgi:hypothetical protein